MVTNDTSRLTNAPRMITNDPLLKNPIIQFLQLPLDKKYQILEELGVIQKGEDVDLMNFTTLHQRIERCKEGGLFEQFEQLVKGAAG